MPDFEQGDIIRVPFPYTDRNTRQHRPALVISNGGIGDGRRFLWVVMITSAENRRWDDDVPVGATDRTGLPVPSLVRPAKVATIEVEHAGLLGRAPAGVVGRVLDRVSAIVDAARK